MSWISRAKDNLFKLSVEQNDFIEATKEFVYIGLVDNEDASYSCELCDHPNIRYEYTIKNTLNNNSMIVGSECINKFIDSVEEEGSMLLDDLGFVVDNDRLIKDKKEYFQRITVEMIEEHMWESNFKDSILRLVRKGDGLSPKQASKLNGVYYYHIKGDIKKESAFKNAIKINLRKHKNQHQLKMLNQRELQFVSMFLSSEQKKRLGVS